MKSMKGIKMIDKIVFFLCRIAEEIGSGYMGNYVSREDVNNRGKEK